MDYHHKENVMKYAVWIACCAFLIGARALAQTSSEQGNARDILVTGGVTFSHLPFDFKDNYKAGWNAGFGYGYTLPEGKLGTSMVYATAEFGRFALDREKIRAALQNPVELIASDPSTFLALLVNFRGTFTSFSSVVQPYFFAGIGYLRFEQGGRTYSNNVIEKKTQNGFAWNAGVGVNIPVSEKISVFLQGRSLLGVFEPTRQFFPINTGILYTY